MHRFSPFLGGIRFHSTTEMYIGMDHVHRNTSKENIKTNVRGKTNPSHLISHLIQGNQHTFYKGLYPRIVMTAVLPTNFYEQAE